LKFDLNIEHWTGPGPVSKGSARSFGDAVWCRHPRPLSLRILLFVHVHHRHDFEP